jgi:multidrug efflux pump subunit AcrB
VPSVGSRRSRSRIKALFPATTISFNLAAGASLSQALAELHGAEREIGLPETITASLSGAAAEFEASLRNEGWLILAAIVTVYIVLGVLYESFIHPVTILSTLPSAGVGALLALMLFGKPLDLISLIGVILLIGIVKKNAIMIVDFALQAERLEGMPPGAGDPPGLRAALSPDHDDDDGSIAWRLAARDRRRAPARSCAAPSVLQSSAGCC